MKKNILILILLFLIYNGYSQHKASMQIVNPDFIKYQKALTSGNLNSQTNDGHSLGYIPPASKPNYTYFNKTKKLLKSSKSFPSKYDLRSLNYVSPVKDQKNCGDCWAFATFGSIESRWMILGYGTYDLSENNLKNCTGFEWQPCQGGNSVLSTAYLSRLSGPVSEVSDPYVDSPGTCTNGLTPVAYECDARFLPNDMNTIKQAVTDYGALYSALYYADKYYNSANYTYYCDDSSLGANHAVTLVGWDDTKVTAGGTGAWIMKNNWNTSWGDKGFFYISYNDAVVLSEATYFPNRLDYKPSSKVYDYDDLGWVTDFGYDDETAYALVKFTASDNNPLYKIGTWINTAGAIVDISVYSGFDGSQLSGLKGTIPTQTCDFPGYFTFDLPSEINFKRGNDFYVYIKYYTPGYYYPIPVEAAQTGYADPSIETDKCWSSMDGSSWDAIGNNTVIPADLCINAYSYNNCNPPLANITINGSANLCDKHSVLLTANTGIQYTYQWLQNNIMIEGATSSSYTAINAGKFSVEVSDNTGCSLSSQQVNIFDYTLNTGKNASINCGDSIKLAPSINYPTGNFIKLYDPSSALFSNIGLADFGANIQSGYINGGVVYQKDNSGNYDGCSPTGYTNGSFNNKIALIDRGNCNFSDKAYMVQLAGAKAVIIVNNIPGGSVSGMTSATYTDLVNIPVVMISYEAGDTIKQDITNNGYANVSIGFDGSKLKFSWSPSYGLNAIDILNPIASPHIKTTYTLTVTTEACNLTGNIDVSILNAPKVNLGSDTSIYNNQTINLDAGAGYSSYLWNDNSSNLNLLVNGNALSLGVHIYSATVTDISQCMGTDSININILSSGYNITGSVLYDNSISSPIKNAKVYLTDIENNIIKTVTVDSIGGFKLTAIQNGTYKLFATTSTKWGGVDPIDAMMINSYFVKLVKFKDNLTSKAAYVTSNNSITPIDALAVLRRFVKLTSSFKSGDWLSDNLTIIMNSTNMQQDIRMVCFGDVNASYKPK